MPFIWFLFQGGPGYPFIVGIFRLISSTNFIPIIILQIILSSLTCLYIFKIAELLLESKLLALISGMLVAVSVTSIALANGILSETIFFFLFVISMFLYFKGIIKRQSMFLIYSGIIGGIAVLVRSTTIFFPAIIIYIALLIPIGCTSYNRKEIIKFSAIAALIMISIPMLWSARNYSKYDTFIISGTGAGAAQNYLAGMVNFTAEDRPKWQYKSVRDSMIFAVTPDANTANFKKYYTDAKQYVTSTFKKYPTLFIKQYFEVIAENITIVSGLHFQQLPRYSKHFNKWELALYKGNKSQVIFIFSLLGFLIIARKNLRTASILLIIMFYFALTSGVTFWQGSRIFYPAIISQSIFVSAVLLFIFDLIILLKRLVFKKPDRLN